MIEIAIPFMFIILYNLYILLYHFIFI